MIYLNRNISFRVELILKLGELDNIVE